MKILRTIEEIEPVLANEEVSKNLNIPEGAPVFALETVTYNIDQEPIEYSKGYFRGDRSKFTIERNYK